MNEPVWLSGCKEVPAFDVEIFFLLYDELYFGPDNGEDLLDKRLYKRLELPDFPRRLPKWIATKEAVGHERDVAAYYLNTLKVARDHELQFKSIQHHFWLRLQLWSNIEKVSIAFPWYDTKREIDRFLNSVRSDDAGEVYFDGDQGWELQVYANDGRLFFRESDPDADEVRFELSCDRDKLAEDIQILQERTSQIIAELTRRLGADVWTEVADRPDFYLYRADRI